MNKENETKETNEMTENLSINNGQTARLLSKEEEKELGKYIRHKFNDAANYIDQANRKLDNVLHRLSFYNNNRFSEEFINEIKIHLNYFYTSIFYLSFRELNKCILHFEVENMIQEHCGEKDDNEEILDFGQHGSSLIDEDNEHLYPKHKKVNKKSNK